MAENDDKAKKLKEIQERLAEIQGKSGSDKASTYSDKTKSINKKSPENESKTEKDTDIKKAAPPPVKKEEAKISTPRVTKEEAKIHSPVPKTQEEKNWQANRVRSSDISPKSKANRISIDRSSKKSSLSKVYSIVSLLVTASVLSYFIYIFFIKDNSDSDVITTQLPVVSDDETALNESSDGDVVIEADNDVAKGDPATSSNEVEKLEEPDKSAESTPKMVTEKRESKPPKPVKEVVRETSPPVQSKVPKGIIISYASNSQKSIAENNVRFLQGQGFKASFYYMPDKDAGSPKLYKVYVGPYPDEESAMPDFRKVVDLNQRAFILRMN